MPPQIDPLEFYAMLNWIDGRNMLETMEQYRRAIHRSMLWTFRPDGSPLYRRGLEGRMKKTHKTSDLVEGGLEKLMVWKAAGNRGNQIYFVASDMGQANDDLELAKLIIRCNPILEAELTIKSNVIERKDGGGFIEILPAGDAPGLHGKTYLLLNSPILWSF